MTIEAAPVSVDKRGMDAPSSIPAIVIDVELSDPVPPIAAHDTVGHRRGAVWVVVRLFTEPLGMVTLTIPTPG